MATFRACELLEVGPCVGNDDSNVSWEHYSIARIFSSGGGVETLRSAKNKT